MTDAQTTYDRATSAYDKDHERALMEAITRTIFETSAASDADAIVIRTAECAQALVIVLAGVLAMSPAATPSPTAIRRTIEDLGKRLRRQLSLALQHGVPPKTIRHAVTRGASEEPASILCAIVDALPAAEGACQ